MTGEQKASVLKTENITIEERKRAFHITAHAKRAVDVFTQIPGAREEYLKDNQAFIEKWKLDLSHEDIDFLLAPKDPEEKVRIIRENDLDNMPESFFRYRQFLANKIYARDNLISKSNVPSNERVKKWRERQIGRCEGALGGVNEAFVHALVTYELAEGCSVGCEFCGLGAGRLKSVFRYTEENAKLFRDVLKATREILGDAAGGGMMYFATEPLDNPDYEKFEQDYLKEFGIIPQITTAVADRDIERTRYFVHELYGGHGFIHRFSLRSLEMTEKILDAFSAEELLSVELLPQFKEAPSFVPYTVVGKQRENVIVNKDSEAACVQDENSRQEDHEYGKISSRLSLEEYDLNDDGIPIVSLDSLKDQISDPGTICCIDGFRINFARKQVTVFTPCHMSDEHPNGISEAATLDFADGDDFKEKLLQLIDEYMVVDLPDDEPLKLYDYFRLAYDEKLGTVLVSLNGGETMLLDKLPKPYSIPVVKLLLAGNYTKQEIVRIIIQKEEVAPENIFYLLSQLWKKGFIVDSKFFSK